MSNPRQQVKDIIHRAFSFDSINEFSCANLTTDVVTNQLNICYDDLVSYFSQIGSSQAMQETQNENLDVQLRRESINELVNQIFQIEHTKKQLLILRLINKLVNNRIIEVRYVCEFMLNNLLYSGGSLNQSTPSLPKSNANIKPTNTFIWCKVLELIRKFIPSHDYKSCRDIFKMLLEVLKRIPHSNSSYPPHLETELLFIKSANKHKLLSDYNNFQDTYYNSVLNSSNCHKNNVSIVTDDIKIESLFETIKFLLDPDKYFMPRYLAINEIKTVLTFGREPYHPRFHALFSKFIESFIPTAHLISVSGRDRLLPIVGFSNLHSLHSFWRFNPNTCKFNTGGPLPYFKHVSKPHHEVYFYILRQSTPQYFLLNLMSLHRTTKGRFLLFEEEFANSILDAMYLTEKNLHNHFENLRIWNNLFNHLVNAIQIIHLPALWQQLSTLLRKKSDSFKNSRDWLMWFLLQIITSYMFVNRGHLPEFTDLYELLYKDEEPLPNPDLSSFISAIHLAPLTIWINLNLKLNSQNQESNSNLPNTAQNTNRILNLNKSFLMPEILKNHLNLIQQCISCQDFNQFAISICLNAYSSESSTVNQMFSILFEKIGKNSNQMTYQQQQLGMGNSPSNTGSPGNPPSASIFTNHQPLSMEMIASFTLHVRIHITNYLSMILTHKNQTIKNLNLNISASLVETFARLIIFDPDNFVKYFSSSVWHALINFNIQVGQQLNPNTSVSATTALQTTFLYQQLNLLIEMIFVRLRHLNYTHKTTFLYLLNSLFSSSMMSQQAQQLQQQQAQQQQQQQAQQGQQGQGQLPGQAPQPKSDQINFLKHPIVYVNSHCAILKLLSSFSGSDYYELLNSIYTPNKHALKYFINSDSDEINKAIVIVIARAVNLTSHDLYPLENKEKEDTLRGLLREIMQKTPIYFHEYTLEHFPKVMKDFFLKEQQQVRPDTIYADSSNKQYKSALKKKVDEDYRRFLDCKHETQMMPIFTNNAISAHTLICILFNLLTDEKVQQNIPNYRNYLNFILSYLNTNENKKITQSIRTFCDYLIIECSNNTMDKIRNYVSVIIRMINHYNVFTYDRFLFIMTFRSFDSNDTQIAFQILNLLFVQNMDFQTKLNDFFNFWNSSCSRDNDEWNPTFYAQYIRSHPEKFHNEGLKEELNMASNENLINTYYGNIFMRCVPVLDFLNNRYIELDYQSSDAENLIDKLNVLYKYHHNPISYVYNSLIYYNGKFQTTSNSMVNSTPQFTELFQNYLSVNDQTNYIAIANDIANMIDINYYYGLIRRLVIRMLDKDPTSEFNKYKSEFQNPSCHMLYITLCELMSLELFTNDPAQLINSVCTNIIHMFIVGRFHNKQYAIDEREFVYWANAAGIIIANLPEPYWHPIYEIFANTMKTDELLNRTEQMDNETASLFDNFDLYLADEKKCFTQLTLIITLFHSLWCHSSANHFHFFVRMLKTRKEELIKTESHFLFICKLIGPFLSKIHMENTNLFIDLAQELYDMIGLVDRSNQELYHLDTICNFFYHLKYRHIGESIKEKIHTLIPNLRPELRTKLKYITSELNQQLQQQQQQHQHQQLQQPAQLFNQNLFN